VGSLRGDPRAICRRPSYVTELSQEFRDILLDVLIRANAGNTERVYRVLATFGAPLEAFQVGAADFATDDGVLQIGLPPRRVDNLNRLTASPSRRPSQNARVSPWREGRSQ
jgi:hypothetical protein